MPRSSTFTTYVSIEEAKTVDRNLQNLEKKSGATFAKIARDAANASAATQRAGRQNASTRSSCSGRLPHRTPPPPRARALPAST
jgi:hypothetical protein